MHRRRKRRLCYEADVPQPSELLLLLREAEEGPSEVAPPQGGATSCRGGRYPEQPGSRQEASQTVPHQQPAGGRPIRLPDEIDGNGRGGGAPPPPGGRHRRPGRLFLPYVQPRYASGRGAANLPQQGRDREALPLAEERDRDQAYPSLDGGRRLRRPPHRLHRAADDQFDTLFREASETHVNEIHHRFVAKNDSYGGFDGRRSEKAVLLELQRGQQGHLGRIYRRDLVENAHLRAFSMRFRTSWTNCQHPKPVKIRSVKCQSRVI